MAEKKQIFDEKECKGKKFSHIAYFNEDLVAIVFKDCYIVFKAVANDGWASPGTIEISHGDWEYEPHFKE